MIETYRKCVNYNSVDLLNVAVQSGIACLPTHILIV